MILLIIGIAAVLIVLIAVLVGQYFARRDQPPEPYDIHAVLDETGEQVDATVFAARAPKSGLR